MNNIHAHIGFQKCVCSNYILLQNWGNVRFQVAGAYLPFFDWTLASFFPAALLDVAECFQLLTCLVEAYGLP
jgi:hypothetical protein